jgi:signal recognition particle subunit SRP54
MLDNLTQRLARVMKTLRGEARLTEANIADALREVRLALLEADVALPAIKELIAAVKEKAIGEEVIGSLSPGQALVGVVHRELTRLMGEAHSGLNLATQPPAVVLMAGLQGSGKTTTVGKLAKMLRETQKKKGPGGVLRRLPPGGHRAVENRRRAGGRPISFLRQPTEKPVDIARSAVDWAKRHYHDVLLVDTAGRLAIDEAMMKEIAELHAAIRPIETLFVVDAMLGQDAINTARAFSEALPLTGIILTKLDGDARGGAALSVRHVTGRPIKYAGIGEKLTGLEAFHPERMASRILGMGDVLSLIEDARKGSTRKRRRVRQEAQVGQGLRSQRLQGPDRPDAQDGRPVVDDRETAGTVLAGRRPVAGRRRGEGGGAHRRDHQLDDPAERTPTRNCSRPRASAASRWVPGFRCRK